MWLAWPGNQSRASGLRTVATVEAYALSVVHTTFLKSEQRKSTVLLQTKKCICSELFNLAIDQTKLGDYTGLNLTGPILA